MSRRIVWLASSRTGRIIGQFLLPEPRDPRTGEQMLALLPAFLLPEARDPLTGEQMLALLPAVEDEVDGDARAASPDQPITVGRMPFPASP
jgi:hypothetical protein